jgi:hypothetical protein
VPRAAVTRCQAVPLDVAPCRLVHTRQAPRAGSTLTSGQASLDSQSVSPLQSSLTRQLRSSRNGLCDRVDPDRECRAASRGPSLMTLRRHGSIAARWRADLPNSAHPIVRLAAPHAGRDGRVRSVA